MENQNIQNKIEVREFIIPDEFEFNDESALQSVKIVRNPAVQQGLILFDEQKPELHLFKIQDEQKQLICAPALIPGMQIKRFDIETNELYYGYFSAESIRKLVYKFNEKGLANKAFGIDHDKPFSKSMFIVEQWFTREHSPEKDYGYELPVNSWFPTLHIKDKEEFSEIQSMAKEGLTGFSVEAFLDAIQLFSKSKLCSITSEMVTTAKIKKTVLEFYIDEFKFSPESKLQYWNKQCTCKQCIELKSMKYNLPGVLPDYPEFIKQIGI